LIADAVRPTVRSTTESGSALDIPLAAQEDDAVDTLLFAHLVASAIRPGERQERYREAIRSVQSEVSRELIDNRVKEGRPLPIALTALRSGDLSGLRFSSRSMDAQLLFAVISSTNNPIAPYEIEVEKEQRNAVESLWGDAYGYPPADARVVVRSIAAAEGAFGTSWGKYAIGAGAWPFSPLARWACSWPHPPDLPGQQPLPRLSPPSGREAWSAAWRSPAA
jgi:hypothetical protein